MNGRLNADDLMFASIRARYLEPPGTVAARLREAVRQPGGLEGVTPAQALVAAGRLLTEAGELDEAVTVLRTAADLAPPGRDDHAARIALAIALALSGTSQPSEVLFPGGLSNKARLGFGQRVEAALALAEAGQEAEALRWADEALEHATRKRMGRQAEAVARKLQGAVPARATRAAARRYRPGGPGPSGTGLQADDPGDDGGPGGSDARERPEPGDDTGHARPGADVPGDAELDADSPGDADPGADSPGDAKPDAETRADADPDGDAKPDTDAPSDAGPAAGPAGDAEPEDDARGDAPGEADSPGGAEADDDAPGDANPDGDAKPDDDSPRDTEPDADSPSDTDPDSDPLRDAEPGSGVPADAGQHDDVSGHTDFGGPAGPPGAEPGQDAGAGPAGDVTDDAGTSAADGAAADHLVLAEAPNGTVLWWPQSEYLRLARQLPGLAASIGLGWTGHTARTEAGLRARASDAPGRIALVAADFGQFATYLRRGSVDPREPGVLTGYAAVAAANGTPAAWPPRSLRACWCGSGRRYRRCCAAAGAAILAG